MSRLIASVKHSQDWVDDTGRLDIKRKRRFDINKYYYTEIQECMKGLYIYPEMLPVVACITWPISELIWHYLYGPPESALIYLWEQALLVAKDLRIYAQDREKALIGAGFGC